MALARGLNDVGMVLRYIGLDCHQSALVADLPLYSDEHVDVDDSYLQSLIQRLGVPSSFDLRFLPLLP